MNVLVIGGGSIGKRHIRNLCTLDGVTPYSVDLREDRREETVKDGSAKAFASIKDALAEVSFDAAIVANPTAYHIETCMELCDAGIHMLVEKPLDSTLDNADELVAAIEKKNLVAMIGYCLRFKQNAARMKTMLDEGVIGRPLYAKGDYSSYLPNWHPWEDYRTFYMAKLAEGGGALLDESHVVDLATMMLGDMDKACAFVNKVSDLEIDSDDTFDILGQTKNGVTIHLHGDLFSHAKRSWFRVVGTEGTITWRVADDLLILEKPQEDVHEEYEGDGDPNIMYIEEIKAFLEAVKAGNQVEGLDIHQAVAVQKVLDMARSESGKNVFSL